MIALGATALVMPFLGGCLVHTTSGQSGPTAAPASETVTASATSSPSTTATLSPAPLPNLSPAPLPTLSLPSPTAACPRYCFQMVHANLDGTNPNETISIYSTEPLGHYPFQPVSADAWHLRVSLPSGPLPDLGLSQFGGLGSTKGPGVLAVVDANGDGRDEVFIRTDAGASTSFVTIFGLAGAALKPATLPGGRPATFPLSGTVTHQGAVSCRMGPSGPELVTDGMGLDPGQMSGISDETTYRWAGLALIQIADSQGAFSVPGADTRNITDPHALAAMNGLHCFGASALY